MRRAGGTEIARGPIPAWILLLLLLLAGPRCASLPAREGGDASLLSRLAGRSWTVAEPARAIGPGNLYEEIDGEAELFLPFDFRELMVGIVTPAGNKKAEVRFELFRHATSRDAFGIYSQHRFPGQEVETVGTSEAIVSDTSLDFFQGTHFVRIRAASRTAARSDLEKLGRALSSLLPGTGDPPPETQALRIPGLVEGSIVFHKRALLGYEALAPGYEAKYESEGISATLILIEEKDVGPTSQFLEKLSGALPEFASVENGLFRMDIPSGTLWLIFRHGYYLGAAGKMTQEQAGKIIAAISNGLPRVSFRSRQEGDQAAIANGRILFCLRPV